MGADIIKFNKQKSSGWVRPPAAQKRQLRRRNRPIADLLRIVTTLCLISAGILYARGDPDWGALPQMFVPAGDMRQKSTAGMSGSIPSGPFALCHGRNGPNCVVDGDTLWIGGEKIRIANIDTPEYSAGCQRERRLARQATRRLQQLTQYGPLQLRRQGHDRYGRVLARISNRHGDVGDVLVREGLAARWQGRKVTSEHWCRA